MNAVTNHLFDDQPLEGTMPNSAALDPKVHEQLMDVVAALQADSTEPHHAITDNKRYNAARGTYRNPKQRHNDWLQRQSLNGQSYDLGKIIDRMIKDDTRKHEKLKSSKGYRKQVAAEIDADNIRRYVALQMAQEWIDAGAIQYVPETTIRMMQMLGMSIQPQQESEAAS